jgi:hypothetical protein
MLLPTCMESGSNYGTADVSVDILRYTPPNSYSHATNTSEFFGASKIFVHPQMFTGCAHLAPQNAPQIESCVDVACCRPSSLFLIKLFCVVYRGPLKTIRTLSHG